MFINKYYLIQSIGTKKIIHHTFPQISKNILERYKYSESYNQDKMDQLKKKAEESILSEKQ
jgi:hypothetical protein